MNAPGPEKQLLDRQLERIRLLFYPEKHLQQSFYRDRQRLLHALTWPASWLLRRGLRLSPTRYARLLDEQLITILTHADRSRCQIYFPAYLLKCIQEWFAHHGDELCDELSHIRNALWQIETIVARMQKSTDQIKAIQEEQAIKVMAQTHAILSAKQAQNARNKQHPSQRQMNLF